MKPISQLHKAATWYARHGYHVFPLVPGTKRPATHNGLLDATTDTSQVDAWWHRNPHYNIGIACGPSGIVVIDFDVHKGAPPIDSLFDEDDLVNTVMSTTPHGGYHLWFKQPSDMTLTNARGGLPDAVDVRAHGGYIVAPPSTVGRAYSFTEDHRPTDTEPGELPDAVLSLLAPEPRTPHRARATQTAQEREIREALTYIPKQGDYEAWCAILMAVHSVYPDEVGISLCEEWSPGYKGEIAKKFASFKRDDGITIATLFHTAKQHGYHAPLPAPDDRVRAELFKWRGWVQSAACAEVLRQRGITRRAELVSILDALLILGHERGTNNVAITHRTLADICDIAPMTSWRRLLKLQEIGLVTINKTDAGSVVDLSPLGPCVSDTVSCNNIKNGEVVSLTHEGDMDFRSRHRADDAFTSYPYFSAVKRRGGVAPLMTSLGPSGWLLWPHLERGGSLDELAEVTGMSASAVRHALKKFMSCALVALAPINKQGFYQLIPKAEELLDEIRPHMVTAGVGQMRIGRNASATADYAAFRLRQRKKMEPSEVLWWERLRERNDRQACLYFDSLLEQGFDARMKVGTERRVRERTKFDPGEEWRTWGRPLYDECAALGDMAVEQKVRLLTMSRVGENAGAERWRAVYREVEERVEMMMMLAPKRVKYERTGEDYYEEPSRMGFRQLDLFEVPHG